MEIRHLAPTASVDVPHLVKDAAFTPDDSVIGIMTLGASVTLWGQGGEFRTHHHPGLKNWPNFALHPSGRLYALADGSLHVFDADGRPAFNEQELRAEGECRACSFSPDGSLMWDVRGQGNILEVHARSCADGSRIASLRLEEDEYQGMSPLFDPAERPLSCALCLLDVDYQMVLLLRLGGRTVVLDHVQEGDVPWPLTRSWSPDRTRWINYDSGIIRIFGHANQLLKEYPVPWDNDDEENFDLVAWLAPRQILLSSLNGRLFVFDPEAEALTAEVVIQGYEPRPLWEVYYPSLEGENDLGTALNYWCVIAGDLLASFDLMASPNREGCHRLLRIPLSGL